MGLYGGGYMSQKMFQKFPIVCQVSLKFAKTPEILESKTLKFTKGDLQPCIRLLYYV